jgi:MarR-like DNA-binding transcriptional regulator SgrR of sgrS sRNA
VLRIAAPAPIGSLDPAASNDPFEASLAGAIADPLFEARGTGAVPLLAADLPEIEGETVRIRLRTDLQRHGGIALDAPTVVASLRAAARHDTARWLLAAFAESGGRPSVRAVGTDVVEMRLAAPAVDPARVLAAAPLAILAGADRDGSPSGTGPFSGTLSRGGDVRLAAWARSPRGAPWLAEVRVSAADDRSAAARAFELGELDVSLLGASVYGGGTTPRGVVERNVTSDVAVLLVPNRTRGVLNSNGTWGAVARSLDIRRLRRAGLEATPAVSELATPTLPAARAPTVRVTLELVIQSGNDFTRRLADALTGPLDEAGFALRVESLPRERYHAAIRAGAYDLYVAEVVPPFVEGPGLAGAALAAAGQMDEARALVREGGLSNALIAGRHATFLRALVLGRRRTTIHHRAGFSGIGLTRTHAIPFDAIHVLRAPESSP